jgi:hypothetical protein
VWVSHLTDNSHPPPVPKLRPLFSLWLRHSWHTLNRLDRRASLGIMIWLIPASAFRPAAHHGRSFKAFRSLHTTAARRYPTPLAVTPVNPTSWSTSMRPLIVSMKIQCDPIHCICPPNRPPVLSCPGPDPLTASLHEPPRHRKNSSSNESSANSKIMAQPRRNYSAACHDNSRFHNPGQVGAHPFDRKRAATPACRWKRSNAHSNAPSV